MIETEKINEAVFEHPLARNCMMGMGETSENVAENFKISREK
jgi:acetyl-CoA acyltransferase 1